MVFLLDLKIAGTLLLAFRINVNGPGNTLFISRNISVLNGRVNSEILLRSWQMKEKFALPGLTCFIRAMRSIAGVA
jgi:hypothetical protein